MRPATKHVDRGRFCAGFLLEIISVMSGVGVNILDVEVHTCTECSDDEAFQEMVAEHLQDVKQGRVIRLRVQARSGRVALADTIFNTSFRVCLHVCKVSHARRGPRFLRKVRRAQIKA